MSSPENWVIKPTRFFKKCKQRPLFLTAVVKRSATTHSDRTFFTWPGFSQYKKRTICHQVTCMQALLLFVVVPLVTGSCYQLHLDTRSFTLLVVSNVLPLTCELTESGTPKNIVWYFPGLATTEFTWNHSLGR